jgi:hypothetical protein
VPTRIAFPDRSLRSPTRTRNRAEGESAFRTVKVPSESAEVPADDIQSVVWRITKGNMSNFESEPDAAGFSPFAGEEPGSVTTPGPGTLAERLAMNSEAAVPKVSETSPKSRLGRAKQALRQPSASTASPASGLSRPSMAGFQPVGEAFEAAPVTPSAPSYPAPSVTTTNELNEVGSWPFETVIQADLSPADPPAISPVRPGPSENADESVWASTTSPVTPAWESPTAPTLSSGLTTSPALDEIRDLLLPEVSGPVPLPPPNIDEAMSNLIPAPAMEIPDNLRSAFELPTSAIPEISLFSPNPSDFDLAESGIDFSPQSNGAPELPTIPDLAPKSWKMPQPDVDSEAAFASAAPNIPGFSPPNNDVSVDELRALLTGAPDRFETVEHATWDPLEVAANTNPNSHGQLPQHQPGPSFDGGFVAPPLDSARPGMIDPSTDMTDMPGATADKVKGFAKGKAEKLAKAPKPPKEPKAPKQPKAPKEPGSSESGFKRKLFGKKVAPSSASGPPVVDLPVLVPGSLTSSAPGSSSAEVGSSVPSGVSEVPGFTGFGDSRPTDGATPLPSIPGFTFDSDESADSPAAEKKREKREKKTKAESKFGAIFAKQDGPTPTLTDNLSDRSTKMLRIGAGVLLALGLLLVAFLQFRPSTTPPDSVPGITIENPAGSIETPSTAASGEPLPIPTKTGSTSTNPVAEGEDLEFSEGEDFAFSEGEDFTVK